MVLTNVLSIFSTEVEDKGSDKGSSNVLQKWRTYVLEIFSSEVEDKFSFNI